MIFGGNRGIRRGLVRVERLRGDGRWEEDRRRGNGWRRVCTGTWGGEAREAKRVGENEHV